MIDGQFDEIVWFIGCLVVDFWENFFFDFFCCDWKMEIYMIFDEDNFYIGVKCYVLGKDYVVFSLCRDYWVGGSDNIIFLFDFFCDCINVFVFGMNFFGVM